MVFVAVMPDSRGTNASEIAQTALHACNNAHKMS